jgi:hypothetical protein
MQARAMLMPFGKYKGRKLYDVPKGYLAWLERNTRLQPDLLAEIQHYLHGTPRPIPQPDVAEVVSSFDEQLAELQKNTAS